LEAKVEGSGIWGHKSPTSVQGRSTSGNLGAKPPEDEKHNKKFCT